MQKNANALVASPGLAAPSQPNACSPAGAVATTRDVAAPPPPDTDNMSDCAQCCWYGAGGALITDAPVKGLSLIKMPPRAARFYGGDYMIAESMSFSTAQRIAVALGLRFMGSRS